MTKRILGAALAAVIVLGLAGVAYAAAAPARPSTGLEDTALALAADPAPQPASPPGGKLQQLRACVQPKVDAGAARKDARKECAAQLGIMGGGKGKPFGLGRAAHAEAVVPKKGAPGQWETVVLDRGKVTAASADSLSIQRPDGPTVTVKVVAGTKVKGADKVADLAVDRQVVVVSSNGEARAVAARS